MHPSAQVILLGLAELLVVLAATRAFRDGVREGGVLRGYAARRQR